MNVLRLRYVKGGLERLEEDKKVIIKPQENKGHWKSLFSDNNPIHVECVVGIERKESMK